MGVQMSPEEILQPITSDALQNFLSTCKGSDLLAFKLTNGDILLGGIPRGGGIRGDTVNIAFNMPDGKRYGLAQYIKIEITSIASVSVVPLSEASIPTLSEGEWELEFLQPSADKKVRLPVHNFPNPLASIIHNHNMPIVESHGFTASHLIEESLSQDGISEQGIHFDKDFLMYADWEFFQTQTKGETSIAASPFPGLVQVEHVLKSSNEEQVVIRIRNSLTNRILKFVPPFGDYRLLEGVLLVPEPLQDEEIEGETSYLYRIATSQGDHYPILVKAKKLKYPRSFLDRVSSQLTFYGEMASIPVSISGYKYERSMLVRAIAYLAPG